MVGRAFLKTSLGLPVLLFEFELELVNMAVIACVPTERSARLIDA